MKFKSKKIHFKINHLGHIPMRIITEKTYLTYDDVLLRPRHSQVLPNQVNISSQFSRNVQLKIPLSSAAMDTVTESSTAIAMAKEGGIGVIHKNLGIEDQAREVNKVKKFESGMVMNPIVVSPEDNLKKVIELKDQHGFSGFPVVDEQNQLVGIITNRDIRFETNYGLLIKDIMTASPVTIEEGTSIENAKKLLHQHRIEKLPVLTKAGELLGLITIKDMEKSDQFPLANKDSYGRLIVAAAVGVGENELERTRALIDAGVDVIVIDTAHGHSAGVLSMLEKIKLMGAPVDVIAGNIATVEAAKDLIDRGVDGLKIGVGPGSICTTRVIAGVGVPQLDAIFEISEFARGYGIPCIADGGIKYSGDIVKALAAGAQSVMIGSLLAGTDTSPGEMILYQGRAFKVYRGMGSLTSMDKGSKDRYGQNDVMDMNKLVPEGIEGQVPYRGKLKDTLYQLLGGLRSGMGYVGAENINELFERAEFVKISNSSFKESHPHDVIITKDAPNYRMT
ncbi:IMP dehydrogenase [Bacteriovoracaceae bacterium]|nr:IMP dehydrogenase [Bacteriovoracaceae bacterium]